MRKFPKSRYALSLIAAAVVVVACSEAARHPVAPTGGGVELAPFGPVSIADDIGQCMGDDAVDFPQNVSGFGTDPLDFNCTANDVSLANARTASGTPIQCSQGDTVTVDIVADVTLNSQSPRRDVGIWIGYAGSQSAESGTCAFFYLPLGSSPAISNADGGPDTCGDLDSGAVVTGFPLDQIQIVCEDPNNDGLVVIPSCVSWTQPGGDRVCSADSTGGRRAGTLPANKSKCNCEPFTVAIQIQGSLTIVKNVVNDNGGTAGVTAFGVNTDAGSLVFGSAVVNGSTSTYTAATLPVDSGSYTLRENDITGYSEGTWSCTGGTPSNTSISAGAITIAWLVYVDVVPLTTALPNTGVPAVVVILNAATPAVPPLSFTTFLTRVRVPC